MAANEKLSACDRSEGLDATDGPNRSNVATTALLGVGGKSSSEWGKLWKIALVTGCRVRCGPTFLHIGAVLARKSFACCAVDNNTILTCAVGARPVSGRFRRRGAQPRRHSYQSGTLRCCLEINEHLAEVQYILSALNGISLNCGGAEVRNGAAIMPKYY